MIAAMLILLACAGSAIASGKQKAAAAEPGHWVYNELAAFKQAFVPVVRGPAGRTTEEEKKALQEDIFNAAKLDNAIEVRNWALLLRTVLNIPAEKADQLLDMYVYGLASGNTVLREDAAGGMVKLLTIKHLSGSASAAELEPSRALVDLNDISERQKGLVQIAYCEGILDGTVNDFFRPGEALTNAEAVSMLYRVIKKYNIDLNDNWDAGSKPPSGTYKEHWADSLLKKSMEKSAQSVERLKNAERIIRGDSSGSFPGYLDSPVAVEKWNILLMNTLGLPNKKYEKRFLESYTFGMSDGKHINRGSAVAGMVKLLHAAELVKGRDAAEEERKAASQAFRDYGKALDQSKLAIAYSEGLILGYGDGAFRPQQMLTNGEALTLAVRIIEKLPAP